jgi:hypothetical protein
VIAQAEAGGSLVRFVGSHSLEDRGAIVDNVRQYVNLGVVPFDHLAVHPDEFSFGESHWTSKVSQDIAFRLVL